MGCQVRRNGGSGWKKKTLNDSHLFSVDSGRMFTLQILSDYSVGSKAFNRKFTHNCLSLLLEDTFKTAHIASPASFQYSSYAIWPNARYAHSWGLKGQQQRLFTSSSTVCLIIYYYFLDLTQLQHKLAPLILLLVYLQRTPHPLDTFLKVITLYKYSTYSI